MKKNTNVTNKTFKILVCAYGNIRNFIPMQNLALLFGLQARAIANRAIDY